MKRKKKKLIIIIIIIIIIIAYGGELGTFLYYLGLNNDIAQLLIQQLLTRII